MAVGDNVDYTVGEPCPFCGAEVVFVGAVRLTATRPVVAYVLGPCGHRLSGFWMAKAKGGE